MSQKPVLVIMAAGMGSRYGGLKQIDPVDRGRRSDHRFFDLRRSRGWIRKGRIYYQEID